jgi:hypothetical protein
LVERQEITRQPGVAGDAPTTRRALRRQRIHGTGHRREPQLPVTARPPWTAVTLIFLFSVIQPGRRGSLLLLGLAEGPTSRRAVLSYALALVGVLFTALFARSYLSLLLDDRGRTVVVHQGLLRRRVLVLGAGQRVVLVTGPARRAVLLDADGVFMAALGAFVPFWRRDDVVVLLSRAGVEVVNEHRLNRASEIEAAYPGSTAWIERSRVRLYGVVGLGTIGFVFLLAWFFEG